MPRKQTKLRLLSFGAVYSMLISFSSYAVGASLLFDNNPLGWLVLAFGVIMQWSALALGTTFEKVRGWDR